MASINTDDLLSQVQAAWILGLSKQAVNQAVKDRRLRTISIGGKVFIPKDEVFRYRPDERRQLADRFRALVKDERRKVA